MKKKIGGIMLCLLLLAGTALFAYQAQAKSKIKLSETKKTMTIGDTTTLKLKNAGKVKWSTNNKSVVSITQKKNNKVTLKAKKAGKAVITGTYKKKTYRCAITVKKQSKKKTKGEQDVQADTINIQIGDTVLEANLSDNSSAEAFKELLSEGPLTIEMSDYGNFEKVGPIGKKLPQNDEYITTEPGDIILYQGNSITIYYDKNSWNFTRLGKITGVDKKQLKKILGDGDVTVTFSLPASAS